MVCQEQSKLTLDDFEDWLRNQVLQVSTKHALGKAISFALILLTKLKVNLEHGELELDNNDAELNMRCIPVGRKNYLFADSERGDITGWVRSKRNEFSFLDKEVYGTCRYETTSFPYRHWRRAWRYGNGGDDGTADARAGWCQAVCRHGRARHPKAWRRRPSGNRPVAL